MYTKYKIKTHGNQIFFHINDRCLYLQIQLILIKMFKVILTHKSPPKITNKYTLSGWFLVFNDNVGRRYNICVLKTTDRNKWHNFSQFCQSANIRTSSDFKGFQGQN